MGTQIVGFYHAEYIAERQDDSSYPTYVYQPKGYCQQNVRAE